MSVSESVSKQAVQKQSGSDTRRCASRHIETLSNSYLLAGWS